MSAETFALAFQQNGSGAVGRTIDAKLKEQWVSVTDYEAVGDGVTDDTAALLAAVAHINTVGGVLYFPRGTYLFSTKLVLTGPLSGDGLYHGHITLMGEGSMSTLKYTGTGVAIQQNGGGDIASISAASGGNVTVTTDQPHGYVVGETVYLFNSGVAALNSTLNSLPWSTPKTVLTVPTPTTYTIAGSGAGAGAQGLTMSGRVPSRNSIRNINITRSGAQGSTCAIELFGNAYLFNLEDFWISNFKTGIRSTNCNGCEVRRGEINACSTGVALGFASNLWYFEDVYVNEPTIAGVDIGHYDSRTAVGVPGANGITFMGCGFHNSAAGTGLVIGGNFTRGIRVLGCYFEGNGRQDITFGHDTSVFTVGAGSDQENGDLVSVEVLGGYLAHATTNPMKIFRKVGGLEITHLTANVLGAGIAMVKSANASGDTTVKCFQDLRNPCYENSAGTQTATTGIIDYNDASIKGGSLQIGATGVTITTDNDGAITFTSIGGGNNEDLTINLDDTANTAVFSSSTGLTTLDFGSFNLTTTGTITGKDIIRVVPDSGGEGNIEIRRVDATNYALLNYFNQTSGGTPLWTLGCWADSDFSLIKNASGAQVIWVQNSSNNFFVAENICTNTAGKGFRAKEGSNAKQGTATLVGGTVTVANTSVTANSRIFLTIQSLGTVAAPKAIGVTARVNGTSFTITSADGTDTSVIAYEIFEPA